ncbi:hypothetical protein [Celeribacter sp.]|uniref:hypothetical protein n=1 Tax=Celeribacter sp. TaxID=1890673 RepID=UPI003A9290B4
MKQYTPPLSLADLRVRIENDTVPTPNDTSILAFLDLAYTVIGAEAFHDPIVLKTETTFSTWFPEQPDKCLAEKFGDAAIYGRCRDSLLRHAKLAGAWSNQDPYTLLNQLAREGRLPGVNRKMMEEYFPGIALRDLTREMVLTVDRDLRRTKRSAFRNSCSTLDSLRDDPRVAAAGCLGRERFGPFPDYRDGDKHRIALPAALAAASAQIPVGHAAVARRAFELAVDIGLLDENGPEPGWSLSFVEATRYYDAAKEKVATVTADLYLRTLLSLLRAANPKSVPANVTSDRVRCPQKYAALANPQPRKTNRQPLTLPDGMEAELADYSKKRHIPKKKIATLRRMLWHLIESGINLDNRIALNDAMSIIRDRCPHLGDDTLQAYRSILKAFLRHTDRLPPWSMLRERAKDMGVRGEDLYALARLSTFVSRIAPDIEPQDIDESIAKNFVEQARQIGKTSVVVNGLRVLDGLRDRLPGLPPAPVADIALKAGELSDHLASELTEHAAAAGYSANGIRARLIAVRALYRHAPDKSVFSGTVEDIPWIEIIDSTLAQHPKDMEAYRNELLRLADQVGRAWPHGWKTLQSKIVDAGIPRAHNPVDVLMEIAAKDDLQPWQVDREWAWVHERSLRADLRRKWARAVDNFDALRSVAEIAESGVLPAEKIGPMPKTGARLKNAHFPLPRRFEAALEGETKQVFEAAHFLWRCLRAFGTHSRGDDPEIGTLVADETLEQILCEQSFMTEVSARIHIARIRDWRESCLGMI